MSILGDTEITELTDEPVYKHARMLGVGYLPQEASVSSAS